MADRRVKCQEAWDGDCPDSYTGRHYCEEASGHEGDHVCICAALLTVFGITEGAVKAAAESVNAVVDLLEALEESIKDARAARLFTRGER